MNESGDRPRHGSGTPDSGSSSADEFDEAEPTLQERVAAEEAATFEARFRGLETTAKRLKRRVGVLSAALLVALAGVGWFAFESAREYLESSGGGVIIQARGFELVGADGVPRAELRIGEDGAAQLAIRDRSRVERMRLTVRGDGSPGMVLQDAASNARVVLGLLPDETGQLVFADRQAATRAVFGLSADQTANLVFSDPTGQPRVALGVDQTGTSSIMLPGGEGSSDTTGGGS